MKKDICDDCEPYSVKEDCRKSSENCMYNDKEKVRKEGELDDSFIELGSFYLKDGKVGQIKAAYVSSDVKPPEKVTSSEYNWVPVDTPFVTYRYTKNGPSCTVSNIDIYESKCTEEEKCDEGRVQEALESVIDRIERNIKELQAIALLESSSFSYFKQTRHCADIVGRKEDLPKLILSDLREIKERVL